MGDGVGVVAHRVEWPGLAAGGGNLGGEHVRVGVGHLPRRHVGIDRDQLVAVGHDGDPRAAADRDGAVALGREHGQPTRREHAAGGHHELTQVQVLAAAPDVRTQRGGASHLHEAVRLGGVFLDHDRVRALGHGGTGEDARRLPFADDHIGDETCGNADDHAERLAGGEIGVPDGVAIHRAVVEARQGAGRRDLDG